MASVAGAFSEFVLKGFRNSGEGSVGLELWTSGFRVQSFGLRADAVGPSVNPTPQAAQQALQ